MSKPKKIQRHGPAGAQPISSERFNATDEELIAACLKLGQDIQTAHETVYMFREGILDGSDAELMTEVVKENRQQINTGIPVVREQPAEIDGKRVVRSEGHERQRFKQDVEAISRNVASAHINPRDPNSGLHGQKTTRRDSYGRVIGLEDV